MSVTLTGVDVPRCRDINFGNASVELDALMATVLGVAADELVPTDRTQFAVLHGYDQHDYTYDANGRLIPTGVRQLWRNKSNKLTEEERTATYPAGKVYTCELSFALRDREADFQTALAELKEKQCLFCPSTLSSRLKFKSA